MIPRKIWMLWLQGWKNAPEIVRICRRTWELHNPTWQIEAITQESLAEFIDIDPILPSEVVARIPPEALSDVIRICLLKKHGGVWVDGTVYCSKPLDTWLPECHPEGFFAFAQPGPDRMLSSWFLAADCDNYLINTWHRMTLDYWRVRSERHHYFWFHYLFGEAYERDSKFRQIWDSTPKIQADGPHHFTTRLLGPMSDEDKALFDGGANPVFKLTHKCDTSMAVSGSVFEFFADAMRLHESSQRRE